MATFNFDRSFFIRGVVEKLPMTDVKTIQLVLENRPKAQNDVDTVAACLASIYAIPVHEAHKIAYEILRD